MSDTSSTQASSWLTDSNFTQAEEPFALFAAWFAEARAAEPSDANAMALATCDVSGLPNVRMVLMKDFDVSGFVFYTNAESQKGQELAAHSQAAAVFHWKSLTRQVRLRGPVGFVSDAEADAYFASRSRGARIGAWASAQSRPLESRFALEKSVAAYGLQYAVGEIPRPTYWRGYRLAPLSIEFWHDRPFRLHDRVVFRREGLDKAWEKVRLYP